MSAECCFCLVDLPTDSDSEWCGAPCKASWTALFGRQEDAPSRPTTCMTTSATRYHLTTTGRAAERRNHRDTETRQP